ncbi:MAG TPA: hypothetical protein PKG52_08310 [bacterium]|nr:hypothetical protein [bacterium]HPS30512.1 hypothetical protein [bacterium]
MDCVKLFVIAVLFFSLNLYGEQAPKVEEPRKMPVPPEVALPDNYNELVRNSSGNWMEKKVNEIIGMALSQNTVVIEKINDMLFLQVVPNYAYSDDKGEERLGEDLIRILEANKFEAPRSAQFMNLDYSQLVEMKLPFKKRLIDSMVIGADKFTLSISLTFFANMNAITNSIFNSLSNIKDFTPIYNSSEKYYRAKFENSKLLYLVQIPNIVYEMVYTGEMFETVISAKVKEAIFLKNVLKDAEPFIEKDKALSFDGRYIKGKDIMIDMWFLAEKTGLDLEKAKAVLSKALKHEAVNISGSEK